MSVQTGTSMGVNKSHIISDSNHNKVANNRC